MARKPQRKPAVRVIKQTKKKKKKIKEAPAAAIKRKPKAKTVPLKSCLRIKFRYSADGRDKASKPRTGASSRSISFHSDISVREYERELGGSGGVPQDNTLVALGLGAFSRAVLEKLPTEAAEQVAVECHRTQPQRVRILQAAMGQAAYQRAWQEQKPDMLKLMRSRNREAKLIEDQDELPTTAAQARKRAAQVAAELARWPLGAPQPPPPKKKAQPATAVRRKPAAASAEGARASAAVRRAGCEESLNELLCMPEESWSNQPWSFSESGAGISISFNPASRQFVAKRKGVQLCVDYDRDSSSNEHKAKAQDALAYAVKWCLGHEIQGIPRLR